MKLRLDSPRVAVLLSTYNGAEFLEAQLTSLAAQTGVTVEVFVRDDGSTDETPTVLKRHAGRWPALANPASGPRVGPAASFLALLQSAPPDFDYYAFCDQDDVWDDDKLSRAVARLADGLADQPALYCSRVMCADRDLRPLRPSRLDPDTRFDHLLFENVVFGNTAVINPAGRQAIVARPPASGVIMHDWWCALVISALGVVIYDERPSVLHRQHGGNCVGSHSSRLAEVLVLARAFWRDPRQFWPIRAQAAEFLRLYADVITPERKARLATLVESQAVIGKRIRYAAVGELIRSRPLDALIGRALVLAGWC